MSKASRKLKLSAFILSFSFLLSACGGGGGGGSIPDKDTTPPTISSKSPDNREIDVDVFQPLTITFNENLNTATENNIVLLKYQTPYPNNFDENLQAIDRVEVTVSSVNNKLIINPVPGVSSGFVEFTTESRYKLTLRNIEDSFGNPMAETTWEFATTTLPNINNVLPLKDETVSRATDITITFSEVMDQASLKSGISLEDLGPIGATNPPSPVKVEGLSLAYDETTNTATYKLVDTAPLLSANSQFKISVFNAKDLKGNIAPTVTSTFNTDNVTTNTKLQTQPSAVIATAHSDRVDITWAAAPAITGASQFTYNVYVSTDNVSYQLLTKTGPIKLLTYTDSSIKPDTKYYYAVTANANGLESLKVFSSFAVIPRSLFDFPSGSLVTVFPGDNLVELNWPSVGSPSYNIYVKVDNATTFVKLNQKPVLINKYLHDSDLTVSTLPAANGSSYIYIIKPVNENFDEGTATLESAPALPVAPKFGEFTFLSNASSISENGIQAKITITRQKGSDGDVSVSYKLVDITKPGVLSATGGIDYTVKSGTVPVAAGVMEHIFYINIIDDKLFEGNEQFEVVITGVTGGAKIGAIATQIVTIIDDEIPPKLTLSPEFKKLNFNWTPPSTASTVYYRLLVNKSGNSGFVTLLDNINSTSSMITVPVVLTTLTTDPLNPNLSGVTRHPFINDSYMLEACLNAQCTSSVASNAVFRKNALGETSLTKTVTIFTSDNPVAADILGAGYGGMYSKPSFAISENGKTLAIGEYNYLDPKSSKNIGVVRVYKLVGNVWQQDGKKITKEVGFGSSVSLSADGSILAIGNSRLTNTPTGGSPLLNAGAAYIYSKNNLGSIWKQVATMLTAQVPEENAYFGQSVKISGDGKTLAVGDNRKALGGQNKIGGVTVFISNSATLNWKQQGNSFVGQTGQRAAHFGTQISLSRDGNTLAIGNRKENIRFANRTNFDAGDVTIFKRQSGVWQLPGKILTASIISSDTNFGASISLSANGNTLVVSEHRRFLKNPNGTITQIDPVITIFNRVNNVWQTPGTEISSKLPSWTAFWATVSISFDGKTLAIGERQNLTLPDNSVLSDVGAISIYVKNGNNWISEIPLIISDKIKQSNSYGGNLVISGDGNTLVVGDYSRDVTDVNGLIKKNAGGIVIY